MKWSTGQVRLNLTFKLKPIVLQNQNFNLTEEVMARQLLGQGRKGGEKMTFKERLGELLNSLQIDDPRDKVDLRL